MYIIKYTETATSFEQLKILGTFPVPVANAIQVEYMDAVQLEMLYISGTDVHELALWLTDLTKFIIACSHAVITYPEASMRIMFAFDTVKITKGKARININPVPGVNHAESNESNTSN